MHIIIGMAVATLLIIGWGYGSLVACVFLTLAPAAALLIFALQHLSRGHPSDPVWILVCIGLIAIIWLPRHLRLRAMRGPVYPVYRAPPPPPHPSAQPTLLKALAGPLLFLVAVTLVLMPLFPR
jgi:hypothetical protein